MRRSPTELRNEYIRLSEVFEHVRAEKLAQSKQAGLDADDLIPGEHERLEMFDSGKYPRSQVLKGLLQGISDFRQELRLALKEANPDAHRFLKHYQEKTGRDYFQDARENQKGAPK